MRKVLLLAGALLLLALLPGVARRELKVSRAHSELIERRIFAYRDWQSTGVRIDQGDRVRIAARGAWLYTPEEYHGPEGHPVYPAPPFYPVPQAAGGALIGRLGQSGRPFAVGKAANLQATEHGVLYLRINDDALTDNEGWVAVQVEVTASEASLP